MRLQIERINLTSYLIAAAVAVLALVALYVTMTPPVRADDQSVAAGEHIITVHDDGEDKGFITKETTLRAALESEGISVDSNDRTEPSLDTKLVANSYQVNIYRARTVVVKDGAAATKVITSYRTGRQIAQQANITVQDEDILALSQSIRPMEDGAAEVLTITRAKAFTFDFYGKTTTAYTQAKTVGEMLKAKNITMSEHDVVVPSKDTPIKNGLSVRLYRNGTQTITQEEPVAFETEQVKDANQKIGYKAVQTAGENGKRMVTYEVKIENGIEVSRTAIASVTTQEPKRQIEIVGTKVATGNGLTKAKGVMSFVDSNGVSHRETYYDLPMSSVMGNCGAGGQYTVREDGVKVDSAGYIIVAANLSRYPRCSVVETSLGAGKVYDTGGFAAVHPDGFDLATDWSNYNGR